MRRFVSAAAIAVAVGVVGSTGKAVAAPPASPIRSGPVTVTLVDSYYSLTASQLVAVVEVTSTERLSPSAYGAVYVGPTGQQVEAVDAIEPDEIFPGATALVVMQFPAAEPGGTIEWEMHTTEDYTNISVSIPLPANTAPAGLAGQRSARQHAA